MNTFDLLTKALNVLKNEEAWYDFNQHFWLTITKDNIKLLKNSRRTLGFLCAEFEKQILLHCKHTDTNLYDYYEICNVCEANRKRDDTEYWGKGTWSNWSF